jgi:DNA helicase HerA-like ATPase
MKDALRISSTLALPVEAVTQTFGILGKRGAGKTNTAVVIAEEMIGAGLPNVIVDPVGVWWGLRSSKDGQRKGLPVYILGGEHGDIPLEEGAGQLVADFVVDTRQPVVLDVSTLSKSASRRFMIDFAERLYRKNRAPLHLTIDEADAFIPQRIEHGAERLVGAINDIVRRGRARGLGVTLISQRPALIHKDVLTQIEVLVAHRLTGPHDRDAIERWVEHHADEGQAREVLSSLASLDDGDAWVWSPGWLGLFQRVRIGVPGVTEPNRSIFAVRAGGEAGAPRLGARPKGRSGTSRTG